MLGGAFDTLVYWHWLALAGLFAGLEILAPGVFLIFLALAAVIVGVALLAMPELDWRYQLLLFALLAVSLIYLGRKIYSRLSASEDHSNLNRRADRLVGQVFPLAGAMTAGRGRLRIGDTDWLARLADGAADLPDGETMRVVSVEGATLIVEKSE